MTQWLRILSMSSFLFSFEQPCRSSSLARCGVRRRSSPRRTAMSHRTCRWRCGPGWRRRWRCGRPFPWTGPRRGVLSCLVVPRLLLQSAATVVPWSVTVSPESHPATRPDQEGPGFHDRHLRRAGRVHPGQHRMDQIAPRPHGPPGPARRPGPEHRRRTGRTHRGGPPPLVSGCGGPTIIWSRQPGPWSTRRNLCGGIDARADTASCHLMVVPGRRSWVRDRGRDRQVRCRRPAYLVVAPPMSRPS